MTRRSVTASLLVLGVACNARPAPSSIVTDSTGAGGAAGSSGAIASAAPPVTPPEAVVVDGGTFAAADAAIPDNAPRFYATALITPIFSAPEWPAHDPTKAADDRKGVIRLGYLRKGQ